MSHKKLRIMIDKLPQKQRDVVMLRIYGRMRHAEIGSHLGISENASKIRYRKAKQNMISVSKKM